MTPSWRGANTVKITVNVWDFGPLGTAITPLQIKEADFQHLPLALNSFIDIVHATENKAIKESTTSEKFEL